MTEDTSSTILELLFPGSEPQKTGVSKHYFCFSRQYCSGMKLLDILQVLVCEGILGQSNGNRDPSAAGLSRVESTKEITAENSNVFWMKFTLHLFCINYITDFFKKRSAG